MERAAYTPGPVLCVRSPSVFFRGCSQPLPAEGRGFQPSASERRPRHWHGHMRAPRSATALNHSQFMPSHPHAGRNPHPKCSNLDAGEARQEHRSVGQPSGGRRVACSCAAAGFSTMDVHMELHSQRAGRSSGRFLIQHAGCRLRCALHGVGEMQRAVAQVEAQARC